MKIQSFPFIQYLQHPIWKTVQFEVPWWKRDTHKLRWWPKMVRGMEDKKMVTKLGSFSLEKKTVFIFLNGIVEKMEIDLASTYTLQGWDAMVTSCSKDNLRWIQWENNFHNEVDQTGTNAQRCCGTSVIEDFKNLTDYGPELSNSETSSALNGRSDSVATRGPFPPEFILCHPRSLFMLLP